MGTRTLNTLPATAPEPKTAARRKLLVVAGVAVALIVGMTLLWRFTPLGEWLQPQRVAPRLEALEKHQWAPLLFIAAYIVGGLVIFPVTVMSAAVAIVFPPYKAVPISFTGILLSAALLHWVGSRLIGDTVRKSLGSTIERVDAALADRGVVTIAALRMIPLAPFTLVNVAAGSVGVPLRDYLLGTALGLAPGITVVCLFGSQVRHFWRNPSWSAVLIVGSVMCVWIAMSLGLQRLVARRNARSA